MGRYAVQFTYLLTRFIFGFVCSANDLHSEQSGPSDRHTVCVRCFLIVNESKIDSNTLAMLFCTAVCTHLCPILIANYQSKHTAPYWLDSAERVYDNKAHWWASTITLLNTPVHLRLFNLPPQFSTYWREWVQATYWSALVSHVNTIIDSSY
jgi:hypothetical protein